jgi:hypothetical protein
LHSTRRDQLARSSTTWTKGQSGNPGGREKRDIDIEKLARSHAPEAIATLVNALRHPRLCVQAASVLLDRGYGRPKQNISGDADKPLIVDFRWADATAVATALQPAIEAAIEVEDEPEAIAWAAE